METKYDIKKTYLRLCLVILFLYLLVAAAAYYFLIQNQGQSVDLYRVEISRVERLLPADPEDIDLSEFETIRKVSVYDGDLVISNRTDSNSTGKTTDNPAVADSTVDNSGVGDLVMNDSGAQNQELHRFLDPDSTYVIREAGGKLYRIDYEVDRTGEHRAGLRSMFFVLAVSLLLLLFVLFWLYIRIIREFHRLSNYPMELAKGNLTIPLREEKNHYFGKFLWGLDMLREKLEQEKQKNLEYSKEKNTFLLSLSHDTKTPLSAIKLYAAAMKKHLYKDPEKQEEIAERIDGHVNEIEGYIAKIISSSGEDFMNFEVKKGEFYLSDAMKEIETYYTEKFEEVGTSFSIGKYSDSLLYGDRDRFVEVLQNLMENAIKYGDGREVTIDFSEEEDVRLITVTNTGCDLPDTELEHIFDSFYRGSNVGNKSGSGLGLYICKKLMNRMNGEIFAETEGNLMKVTLVCAKHGK